VKTQSKQPRFLVIRKGPVWWEWKYREENPSAYRTTKVPSSIAPKDAIEIICHDWLELHGGEVVNIAWELTDEERAAGKTGIPESIVPANPGEPFK